MDVRSAFNAAVCIIGIAILLIHTVNILLKKDRRKDENRLLTFVIFTILHFATYLSFIILKIYYKNNALIIGYYTTFYIMNNVEILLLYAYAISYISTNKKYINVITIINLLIFTTFCVLDIVNIFNHMFFNANNGLYERTNIMIISQGYQFIGLAIVFFIAVFNKKLDISEKIAFFLYCLLPFVAVTLQIFLSGYAIGYLSIVIAIEILFLFINVKKNMALADEEKRTKEAEIKMMMSQIQPHFIYNTLASISTLIKIDPDKAQKGLDDFTEYLRRNLSSLTDTGLIPFSAELRHIETYLSLEKMRFDDRLNIVYDIKNTDFLVPPLSIQPIVENAVKHGILKKIEGGSVIIKTSQTALAYVVEVIDDGVGFDITKLENCDNSHIGLNNVQYRIKSMCNGELIIESKIDEGTKVTMLFYK